MTFIHKTCYNSFIRQYMKDHHAWRCRIFRAIVWSVVFSSCLLFTGIFSLAQFFCWVTTGRIFSAIDANLCHKILKYLLWCLNLKYKMTWYFSWCSDLLYNVSCIKRVVHLKCFQWHTKHAFYLSVIKPHIHNNSKIITNALLHLKHSTN